MIYITVELNKDIYIKIPKVKEGISPYILTMTSQAGGQQMVFTDLVDNSDKSSVFRFTLNFTQYTPSGIYNYILTDTADKQISKGLIQVNMTDSEDYFYQDDELGYFVEDEGGGGDMSNYYTKSQIDSMLTQYEKKTDLPDFNNFVTLDQLSSQSYVTSEEMQTEVESYINSKDLINSTQLANTLEWYVTLNELQSMGYVTASELPTVNDATVTVKQGGNVMGSFTLNQSNNVEILLNEGGQGGEITMNDVKQYVDSQGYVMSSSLDSMSYITSDYLDNAGYITTTNVRENYYNKPETEANFTSYAYIEERISQIPGGGISMDEVKDYVVSQSYITSEYLSNQAYITPSVLNAQAYITLNDVPTVDLSSYVTYTYLEERLSEYQPSVDLSAYVTKTELENCSYVTKNALEGNYYSKTDINAMGYITINDVPGVDLSSYVTYTYLEERLSEYQPSVDLSAYVKYSDLNDYGYITAQDIVNQSYITPSVLNAQAYITTTQLNACGYATVSQIPAVSNAGIVLKQGGVTKGTFTLNQSTGATIDFDGGSVDLSSYVTKSELVEQSYITLNDVPVYDLSSYVTYTYLEETLAEYQPAIDLSNYVTKTDLVNQSYITSDYLANQAYITNTYLDDYVTYTYLEERLSDITIDLSSYVTKQELKDQSYVTKQFLTNRSYVTSQQLVDQSYITMADISAQSYVTKQDMVNQSYVTSQYLDNQSYVTQVQLTSNSYVTSSYMDSFFNNHTTALLFTMGNDTIKVITFYTQDEL